VTTNRERTSARDADAQPPASGAATIVSSAGMLAHARQLALQTLLGQILEANPRDVAALVELERMRRRSGDPVGAHALLEAAKALNPIHPRLQAELTEELRALDNVEERPASLPNPICRARRKTPARS
jgi:hypothetical protein